MLRRGWRKHELKRLDIRSFTKTKVEDMLPEPGLPPETEDYLYQLMLLEELNLRIEAAEKTRLSTVVREAVMDSRPRKKTAVTHLRK